MSQPDIHLVSPHMYRLQTGFVWPVIPQQISFDFNPQNLHSWRIAHKMLIIPFFREKSEWLEIFFFFCVTPNKTINAALQLTKTSKAGFAYQRRFGTVDFLPHKHAKVCPWQEAAKYISHFVMQSAACQERVVQSGIVEDSENHPVLWKCGKSMWASRRKQADVD